MKKSTTEEKHLMKSDTIIDSAEESQSHPISSIGQLTSMMAESINRFQNLLNASIF